jgi:hypothetical protein
MPIFTNNFCRNPSFQIGLDGYSSLLETNISLDKSNVLYGQYSCFVSTPGHAAGEGIICAGGVIPSASLCSLSLYIAGVGDVVVSAVSNPGGTVISSIPVKCNQPWQRVKIEGISATPGVTLFIIVTTSSPTACGFWISGIQVEDSPECHNYCDGDQDGCEWLEGFHGGHSVCHFQNPVVAVSNAVAHSNLVPILIQGEGFFVTADTESTSFSDLVQVGAPGPVGAMSDFAIAQLTDPDPAHTYNSWNNGGSTAGTGGAYNRIWSTFYPPADMLVSNGEFLFKRAAYMGVGFQFSSVPNNGTVNIARVQAEVLPVTTAYSQPSPTAFDNPRAIHSIIKPNRLNYCPNPSIEVSTSGWTATGSAAVAKDGTTSVGDIIEYDDNLLTAGTASLKITVNANSDGAQINVPFLIPGDTYIASAYVQAGPGLANITMTTGSSSSSVQESGGTGYGIGTYNAGPYGGITTSTDLNTSTWFRVSCIFTASSDTETLTFAADSGTDVAYPTHMWVDAILVEVGEIVNFYFDGSFGVNYSWETNGTAGLTRSYYYDQQAVKTQAVINVLNNHTPLGITYDTPQYAVPYTD